jgi:hypothetical protein
MYDIRHCQVTKLGKKGDWIDLKGNSGKLLGRV